MHVMRNARQRVVLAAGQRHLARPGGKSANIGPARCPKSPILEPAMPTRRRCLSLSVQAMLAATLWGCSSLPGAAAPPRVTLAGLEPLAGEGMELRFAARLRVQNPGPDPLRYDGVSLELDLRGQRFASGVAPLRGEITGWEETVLAVPVSASALALAWQLFDLLRDAGRGPPERIGYALRGRLGGSGAGGGRFSADGEIELRPRTP
jgi:hypothetical protein